MGRITYCDNCGALPEPRHTDDRTYCWRCDSKMRNALDVIERVRELHDWIQSGDTKYCMTCIVDEYSWGAEREPYPCPTLRLLAAARGDGEQA